MKLGVLPRSPTSAVSFYRSLSPLGELKRVYRDVDTQILSEINWATCKDMDALFVARPNTQTDLNLMKVAKKNNITIITDWDDHMYAVPLGNPAYHHHVQSKSIIEDCLKLTDLLICSTPAVEEAAKPYCSNTIVIPNAFDNFLFDMPEAFTPRRKNIVWRGGSSHVADVLEHSEQIIQIAKANPDWFFTFIGDTFGWFEGIPNIQFHPFVELVEMHHLLQKLNAAIYIVPLKENVFNKAKSNIAWIEATYAGGVTLAPAWSEEWNKPGITRYKDRKDFGFKLNSLIKNIDSWENLWTQSKDYINENLLLSKLNETRHDVIVNLVKEYYENKHKKCFL